MEINHPEVVYTHLLVLAISIFTIAPAVCIWWRKQCCSLPIFAHPATRSAPNSQWKWVIAACIILAFAMMFTMVSCAWLQVDDWWLVRIRGIQKRITGVGGSYLYWVSRAGEMFIHLTGMTIGRWEPRIINSLVTVLAPLALFRLCKAKGQTIYSRRGVAFYCFTFFLMLLNAHWKCFFHYANCANYLYPSVATAYFLSFYRPDMVGKESSRARCIGLFILGCFCGWGTECLTVTITPLLTFCLFLSWRGKTEKWSPHAVAGYFGYLTGCALLLLAPALYVRTIQTLHDMPLDVSSLGAAGMWMFLDNLSWDKLQLISAHGTICIGQFPLWTHFLFFPYLMERFLSCCWSGLVTFTGLLLFLASERRRMALKNMAIGLAISVLGFAMAVSYLAACIPTFMAFFPACFCITAANCFIFLRLNATWLHICSSLGIAIIALCILIPSGIEAYEYKEYEHAQLERIQLQIAEGKRDIILYQPFRAKPDNRLNLIADPQFYSSPDGNTNQWASDYFGVDSIVQTKESQQAQ